MRIILSLILAVLEFFGSLLPVPAAAEDTAAVMAVTAPAEAAVSAAAVTEPAAGGYADLAYARCDPTAFYADADRLCALADGGDGDAAAALYDELYDELLYMDAMSTLATLGHYDDIYDEYWADEYAFMNALMPEAQDALESAACHVLESVCADSFADHVGAEAAAYFSACEPLTDEELAAYERELALIDEYYELYDTIGGIGYDYRGETWTLDRLGGFRGSVLAERDYDAYLEVFYGLQRAIGEAFAPVYIELVELRKQAAENEGYDSYADYAYDLVYYRDYTPDDAQKLCDAIKPVAREYYSYLYYSELSYAYDEPRPVMDADELLAVLGEYLPRIDKSLLAPWTYLTENGLYDLAPASGGRLDGAFTTAIPYFGSPFIYATLEGDCYDLITLSHEFGHFSDFYLHSPENALIGSDDLDLCEIHSNGLQALFTMLYGEIYGDGAEIAEFANLSFLLENVIDGCLYDEFQRRVFAEADALDAETIDRIHREVCAEYGLYDAYYADPTWDAGWVYISHNFETPFYYISYAASAIAAVELWDMAQEDFQNAVGVYMSVLGRGARADGYFTVLTDCGLRLFTEDGAAEEACRPVLDRLAELDRLYG